MEEEAGKEEKEKGRGEMSSLTVPPVLTSPRDDAMQLYRAFKGMSFLSPFLSLRDKLIDLFCNNIKCCYPFVLLPIFPSFLLFFSFFGSY